MEREKIVLQQVLKLFNELKEETTGVILTNSFRQPSSHYFGCKARELRDKVVELHERFKPDYISGRTIEFLDNVLNEKVDHLSISYSRSIRKGASKKDVNDFYDNMHEAFKLIEGAIIMIQQRAKEIS
jgi:hypothetical protein